MSLSFYCLDLIGVSELVDHLSFLVQCIWMINLLCHVAGLVLEKILV